MFGSECTIGARCEPAGKGGEPEEGRKGGGSGETEGVLRHKT